MLFNFVLHVFSTIKSALSEECDPENPIIQEPSTNKNLIQSPSKERKPDHLLCDEVGLETSTSKEDYTQEKEVSDIPRPISDSNPFDDDVCESILEDPLSKFIDQKKEKSTLNASNEDSSNPFLSNCSKNVNNAIPGENRSDKEACCSLEEKTSFINLSQVSSDISVEKQDSIKKKDDDLQSVKTSETV